MNIAPSKYIVTLKQYDADRHTYVATGQEVSIGALAKSLTPEQLALLLQDYANSFDSSYRRGLQIGKDLHTAHRTIQRSIIVELVGILAGLAEQEHTDPRNAQAIALARHIRKLYEAHGPGPFI